MNKKELIQTIKTDVKFYAQPRNMASMKKSDLEKMYAEAKRLNLVRGCSGITPVEQRELIEHAKKFFVPEDCITANYQNSGTITVKAYCKESEDNEIIYVEAISHFGYELWSINCVLSKQEWKLISTKQGGN